MGWEAGGGNFFLQGWVRRMSLSHKSIASPCSLCIFRWGKATIWGKGMTEKLRVGLSGLIPHKNLQTGGRKKVTGSNKNPPHQLGNARLRSAPSRRRGQVRCPDRKLSRTKCLGTHSFLLKSHVWSRKRNPYVFDWFTFSSSKCSSESCTQAC